MRTGVLYPLMQRAAGRCKAVTDTAHIPSEPHTQRFFPVGCAGFARYRVFECRFLPEQEWYRRGISPLSLAIRDKGVFFYK